MTLPDSMPEVVGKPVWDREAIRRTLSFAAVILALILLPILAHGCHGGDDLDLEPGTTPPEMRRG